MSFREKSAWISLVSIALVSGFYFLHVPWTLTPSFNPALVHGLFLCFVALILIEAVAHLVVAFRAPNDARAPRDERDRLIDLNATRISHYVYVGGSLLAVATIHLGANVAALAYGVLGKYSPSLEVAFRIAQVFGAPLEKVFGFPNAETEE
jgi:hypothetical protein